MTHVRFSLLFALSLVLALSGQPCHASVIVNGDFSEFNDDTGLPTGWGRFEDEDGFVFEAPDYDSDNQYVELSENSQIEQMFNLPAGALRLSFEFKMIQDLEQTVSEKDRDSFQAILYDLDFEPLFEDLFGFFTIDDFDSYFDSDFVTVQPLSNGWQRVILNVESIAPTDGLLLEFLVNGFDDDGRTTTVYVDNVSVSMVPEPATATIFVGLAVFFLAFSRRSRRSRARSMADSDRPFRR